MAARTIDRWFAEYGESHQDPTNTLIHWICVPAIYFSIVGLLMDIPSSGVPYLWAWLALAAVLAFYLRRSLALALGMLAFSLCCIGVAHVLSTRLPWPLWAVCVAVFALAWAGQFYGHQVEGRRPSFLKDLQFLLIGPAWLLAKLYRHLGLRY